MNGSLLQTLAGVASAIAATVINALWEDALLVLGVWLLLRSWPQLNASTRYAVWCATLVAAVVVPVATTIPYFCSMVNAAPASPAIAAAVLPGAQAHASLAAAHHVTPSAPAAGLRLPERFHVTLALPLAVSIFAAWGILALLALARLGVGLVRLEALKRDALPLPVEYRDAMARWSAAGKGSRDVRLCVSDETDVPVAVGLFDAMILIPRVLLERLSESEIDQISLHELAHLRRADDWTNGLQRVLVAMLGWNPAALFVAQQMDLEREVACDDYVLSLVDAVRPYALCLTKMAETASWPRMPIAAPGVFATRKHISLRIERLLGAGRNIATDLAFGPAAAAIAIVGGLALAMGSIAPTFAADISHVFVQPQAAAPSKAQAAIIRAADAAAPKIVERVPARPDAQGPVVPAIPAAAPTAQPARVAQTARASQSAQTCNQCDFAGVNWSGRDLHGASYNSVDFSRALLDGTNFSGGSFSATDFAHATLRGAIFSHAQMAGCDFERANLTGANFTGARITGCDFAHAQLDNANFDGTTLNECDFTGVDMRHVDLSNAHVSNSDIPDSHAPPKPH